MTGFAHSPASKSRARPISRFSTSTHRQKRSINRCHLLLIFGPKLCRTDISAMNRGSWPQSPDFFDSKLRSGQPPQQRPPNLGPSPGIAGSFRPPYPSSYGMAPRSVMPGYPTVPNHRAQSIVPQPSPNYLQQQRGQTYPFGGALVSQQQQQQNAPLGANNSAHSQPNTTPNLGTAQSVSSASEVGLDPNDFPALGSTPSSNTASNNTNSSATTTSYASQASTAVQPGVVGQSSVTATQTRDFTADDFPALGGNNAQPQQPQSQQPQHEHPPGLNGFSDQSHRQNLSSGLPTQPAQQQQQPGLLNLGQQRLQSFQSEADKRVSGLWRCNVVT